MSKEKAVATFKIGSDEIRFEASREAVEAQIEKVLNRLLDRGIATGQVAMAIEKPALPSSQAAAPSPVPISSSETTPTLSEAELIEKFYHVSARGKLKMSRIPKAPGDVLLLVLYGISKVQDSPQVPAPTLVKTAREAGAVFERADRWLAKRPKLVQGTGLGRGRRYRLTPPGEEHCRRLVRGLVGD